MRWTGVWPGLLIMVVSVGGAISPGTAPARASSTSARHTIHVWQMSVAVPAQWQLTGRSASSGTTTWTISGPEGELQLTSTPLARSNPDQLLPLQPGDGGVIPAGQSPYMERSTGYSGYEYQEQFIAVNGTQCSLTLDMYYRTVRSPVAQRIIRSWHHLPVLTPTKAAIKIQHLRNWYDASIGYDLSYGNNRDGWLLTAGQPGTAQQSYYLFHTVNGGLSWQLQRYTVWAGCASATQPPVCAFLRSAGETSMWFWNGSDGIIALADYAGAGVQIYRTIDGGKTWSDKMLGLPQPAENVVLRQAGTALILTVMVYGRRPQRWKSTNGGVSWAMI